MKRSMRMIGAGSALCLAVVGIGATSADAAGTPTCGPAMLSAKVTGTAAGMSQPTSFVTVTNTGASTCTLKGYPKITRAWTKKGKVAIAVTNGGVQNAPQVKVRTVTLKPGQHAWFAIGTATAYDPPVVTLTKVAFTTDATSPIKVKVSQQASAPSGKPIPVGVTAYAKGVGTGQ